MTDLALVTADRVRIVESLEQMTLPAAEAINAGQAVRIDTATGDFTLANGSTAAEARIYGVAARSVIAGQPVTAVKKGVMEGLDLSALNYDDDIFLSNTDGTLADVAGTVSTVVGKVIPGTAEVLGASPAKLLLVDL